MKFISFIASTMLIILISQHSVMGAPLNDTEVEKPCSTGLEMVDGRCKPIDSELTTLPSTTMTMKLETTAMPLVPELTTDSGPDLLNCPEGTKRDDDGSCQNIKPSNSTKTVIDPKELRQKDGSCPPNYYLYGDKCYFSGSTTTLTPDAIHSSHKGARVGQDESSSQELIPILPDNTCPPGTGYAGFGLCKPIEEPSTTRPTIIEHPCPVGSKRIEGQCVDQMITTMTTAVPTTRLTKPIDDHEESKTRPEMPTEAKPIDDHEEPKTRPEKPTEAKPIPEKRRRGERLI